MLDTLKIKGKLANVNVRAEKHGDETVAATDLKLTADFPNDVLDSLEPGLLAALYRAPTKKDDPDLFDGTKDAKPLRKLRFPHLVMPLALDYEWPGYRLQIEHGARGDESALKFADVKVDGIRLEAKDGGTVTMTLRAIIHTEKELDDLAKLIQQPIEFSLAPPRADGQQAIA